MTDASITIVVTGIVQVVVILVGFFTLWIKLRYGVDKAEIAAVKVEKAVASTQEQVSTVETKLDENTAKTVEIDTKASTIVKQTNGSMDELRHLVSSIAERMAKVEDYNRNTAHRVLDALNVVHLKVETLVALQPKPVLLPDNVPILHKDA